MSLWRDDEIEFEFYKSSGPGGQKKNTTLSAVRLRHLPTGIIVTATESRSQHQNKQLALEELDRRLIRRMQRKKPRVPTRPSKSAKERRLTEKRRTSEVKRQRIVRDEE